MKKILFITLSLSLFLFSCGEKEKTTEVVETIKPVKYANIVPQGGVQKATFNGSLQSGSATKLSFRTNGLITNLNVKTGDRVKKGQLLGKLDQKDVSINHEKSKASLSNAQVQLESSKSSLNRMKMLYQSNSASLNDYEQAKNGFANAQTNYQTALKSLELQTSQFAFGKIVAPTDGVISEVRAELNEFAQAGAAIFIMNSNESDFEANVGVPGKYINQIKNGDTTTVSIGKKPFTGIVSEVGFSSGAATYPVIVKLLSAETEIKPGMSVSVTFKIGNNTTVSNQIIAPVKAVSEDQNGSLVYVLEKNEENYVAKRRSIKLGKLTNDGFVVIEGLELGELVAIAGINSLYDGRKVNLLND